MIKILMVIAEAEKESFSEFIKVFENSDNVEMFFNYTGNEALQEISVNPVDFVIVDEKLKDMKGIEFLKKLLSINPMINTAAVSPLSHDDFHEATEGLGVFAQLPSRPGKEEAKDLLKQYENLIKLTS